MTARQPSVFKTFSRRFRLWLYHLRRGPLFDFHGVRIALPERIGFRFKRQIMKGDYEEAERQLVAAHLPPDLPVVELGGSLGVISAYIGSRLNEGVPCRIVEANTALVDVCQRNANSARQNGGSEVVNAAIAYGADEITFAASENVHASKVAGPDGEGIMVPTTTLEEQVHAVGGLEGYALVMDIEGMEYELFQNEQNVLSRCEFAIVEYHPDIFARNDRSLDGFMALVEAAGLKPVQTIGSSVALKRA